MVPSRTSSTTTPGPAFGPDSVSHRPPDYQFFRSSTSFHGGDTAPAPCKASPTCIRIRGVGCRRCGLSRGHPKLTERSTLMAVAVTPTNLAPIPTPPEPIPTAQKSNWPHWSKAKVLWAKVLPMSPEQTVSYVFGMDAGLPRFHPRTFGILAIDGNSSRTAAPAPPGGNLQRTLPGRRRDRKSVV